MNTINEYLDLIMKFVKDFKGNVEIVDEYKAHLYMEYEDIKNKNPNFSEKEFVNTLEPPKIFASSLLGLEPNEINHKIKKTGIIYKSISYLKQKYESIDNPFTVGIIPVIIIMLFFCVSYILYILLPHEVFDSVFSIILGFGLMFILFINFLVIGRKKTLKDIFRINFIFSLSLFLINNLILFNYQFDIISERTHGVNHYYFDWISSSNPTILEFVFYLFLLFIIIVITYFGIATAISIFFYLLKNFSFKKLKSDRSIQSLLILFLLSASVYFVLPNPNGKLPRTYVQSYMNTAPYTPDKAPLIYYSRIKPGNPVYDTESGGPTSIKIPILGNSSFKSYSVLKIDFPTSTDFLSINNQNSVELSPIHTNNGNDSEFPFTLIGVFYIPTINTENYIQDNFNSSFPLNGFKPALDESTRYILWDDDIKKLNIPIISIIYTSTENDYQYKFYFDKRTGWLMEAELERIGSSWYDNFNGYEDLILQRIFLKETITVQSEIQTFRTIELIYTTILFVSISSVLLHYIRKYNKK